MDITVSIDESAIESVVAEYVEGNSYMTHSGVEDTIEEYLKDNGYEPSGESMTESDVQRMLDDQIPTVLEESDVENLIENALADYDPEEHIDLNDYASADDVEDLQRRVDALEDAGTPDNDELERRLDRYAQRTDALLPRVDALENRVADLQNAGGSYEARLKTLEDQREDLLRASHTHSELISALQGRNTVLEQEVARLRAESAQAVNVFQLLKRVAEVLIGRPLP